MDETWGSFLSVVAQFIQGGEPKNVQVKDGYCFVPPELEVGAFELCLRGDDGESVVASVNRLTFDVCEGFDPSGETPLPPSPDLYTQLVKEIDSGKKIAQSVREDADSGKFNGGWYTPSVTQTDENTLRMDFTPSKDDMPDVEHTDIMLPGGGGGISDHSKLSNRDAEDQHPMSAITGLVDALADKQPTGNYLTSEQDPTVPKWAKQPQKPAYTAQEVGALPDTTHIPSTADDINAEPAGAVSRHNVSDAAHSDIRLLIQGLTDRLNALADSDDTTLDQLSEIVLYIKRNRTLIEAITTSKVSVADIIDNLTTNVTNKPLSAAQGVALKALIDAITVPDKLPNPNSLTFTGAVTGSYDGSAPLSVEIPSGGGGYGEIVTADETILASGTIATGTVKDTYIDTGVTLAELRNWKYWTVEVKSTGQTTYWGVGFNGNRNRICRVQHSNIKFQIEWIDSAKTVARVFYASGTGYEYGIDDILDNVVNSAQPVAHKQGAYAKVTETDDSALNINMFNDLTVDALWRVKGVLRYGD